MTREQKELLYNLACWRVKDFNNQMVDRWTEYNYRVDDECVKTIRKLEGEYIAEYGPLPVWKYIDDVWSVMTQLKKELEEN